MGAGVRLGRILGIPIDLDYTWFIFFGLIVLSLSMGYFPAQLSPGMPAVHFWVLGLITTVAFFGCIVAHELAHSYVAKAQGQRIAGITLFIFGGVARLRDEPRTAAAEFKMAVAGPISSLGLAAFFYAIGAGGYLAGEVHIQAVGGFLGFINLALALFNLVPGFPLDGGRILRAAIWHFSRDLVEATRVASLSGQAVGYMLIFGGFLVFFTGKPIPGVWWAFIGWFLIQAAQASYQQVLVRRWLSGVPVVRLMEPEVVSVPAQISLEDLVHHYFLRYDYACFPVMEGDRLLGLVALTDVRGVPREDWATTQVGNIVPPLRPEQTARPAEDAWAAISKMSEGERGSLAVTEEGRLVGIVCRSHVMRFLRTRLELGV